jgi:predicted transcriptional regulator of viral defense system
MKKNPLITRLEEKNKVYSTRELKSLGFTHYSINNLIANRVIEKVKRGYYIFTNSELPDNLIAQQLIPSGIFCLHSAAFIYNYSTHVPFEFHIAIEKKEKYTLPDYPPIKLYYWKGPQYQLGVETIKYNAHIIKVYSREKTVCDFIKFRSKQERAVVNQVLENYLESQDRNLNKLHLYAENLGIKTVLKQYLEVLL